MCGISELEHLICTCKILQLFVLSSSAISSVLPPELLLGCQSPRVKVMRRKFLTRPLVNMEFEKESRPLSFKAIEILELSLRHKPSLD